MSTIRPSNIAHTKSVDVKITSAELLALFATPQTLVAAPGAGKFIVPVIVSVHKPAGTAYAGIAAGEDLAIKYTDASGTAIGAIIEPIGFLDQATAQTRVFTFPAAFTPTENAALVLHMLVAEIITGTSPLYITVLYHELDRGTWAEFGTGAFAT